MLIVDLILGVVGLLLAGDSIGQFARSRRGTPTRGLVELSFGLFFIVAALGRAS